MVHSVYSHTGRDAMLGEMPCWERCHDGRDAMLGEMPHVLHFEILALGGNCVCILIFDESWSLVILFLSLWVRQIAPVLWDRSHKHFFLN